MPLGLTEMDIAENIKKTEILSDLYTSVWAPAQRHIQSPAKHLSWNYFAKTIIGSKLLTIFAKSPSWMFYRVLNTPLTCIISFQSVSKNKLT